MRPGKVCVVANIWPRTWNPRESLVYRVGACTLWEERWQSAFQRPAPGSHFPGNLPLLTSTSPDIDRLYYWAALAMVSLERTNYPSRPRTFVISQGPSNSLDGSAGSECRLPLPLCLCALRIVTLCSGWKRPVHVGHFVCRYVPSIVGP